MKTPIVLIHGIFGTILKSSNRVVWPVKNLFHAGQLKDNLLGFLAGRTEPESFIYSPWCQKSYQPEVGLKAVDKLVKSFILGKAGVNMVDCFDLLIKSFEKQGYKKDIDIQAYTYDFLQLPSSQDQLSKYHNFLSSFDTPPIIIAHSMGALHTKFFIQKYYKSINRLMKGVIFIGAPFDGATGTTLALPLIGYNMGTSLLNGCTRFLWGNSGMSLALMPGSEHKGVTQCIYAQFVQEKEVQQMEDYTLWNSVQIIHDNNDIITSILKQIKLEPQKVQYRVKYWINRFKQFLGSSINIPLLGEFLKESYVEPIKSPVDFFKPVLTTNLKKLDDIKIVQFTQFNRVQPIIDEIVGNNFLTNTNIDEESYQLASFQAQQAELPVNLQWQTKETRSIEEFYSYVYPESSVEQFVFGIVKPMYKYQEEFRKQEFQIDEQFKQYSICGAGVKTPQLVYYEPVQYLSDIRFQQLKIIYGDGDGSVLLTSSLKSGLEPKGKIFAGIGHLELIREQQCISEIHNVIDSWK